MIKNKKNGKSNENKKARGSLGRIVTMGAGAAALGAGAYYFLGPKGKKHQKKAKVLLGKLATAEKELVQKWKDLNTRARPALKRVKKTVKKAAAAMKKASGSKKKR